MKQYFQNYNQKMWRVVILKILQCLINVVDHILGFIFGYTFALGWKYDHLRATTRYEYSAQRLKIAFRAKPTELKPASREHFVLFHTDYIHPNVVRSDNISLMGLTPEQAFFAVVSQEVDIYISDLHPFMYTSQFNLASHLIAMPIRSFHMLAKEIGDPSAQIVLISSTGRCGSTLLAQMFEKIPKTLVMSEPDAFTQAHSEYSKGNTTDKEDGEILRSIVRLQCKAQQTREIDRIIIKTRSTCVRQIQKINANCSYVKHIFMYRQPWNTVRSFIKLIPRLPAKGMRKELVHYLLPMPDTREYDSVLISSHLVDSLNAYSFLALSWICHCTCYIEYKHQGIDIYPLKYEQLLKDAKSTTLELFSYLDIRNEHVTEALQALCKDSQRGSCLERDRFTERKHVKDKERQEVNEILYATGFASLELQELPMPKQLQLKTFITSF